MDAAAAVGQIGAEAQSKITAIAVPVIALGVSLVLIVIAIGIIAFLINRLPK